MLFLIMDLEIGIDNVFAARTACIPVGLPARQELPAARPAAGPAAG